MEGGHHPGLAFLLTAGTTVRIESARPGSSVLVGGRWPCSDVVGLTATVACLTPLFFHISVVVEHDAWFGVDTSPTLMR